MSEISNLANKLMAIRAKVRAAVKEAACAEHVAESISKLVNDILKEMDYPMRRECAWCQQMLEDGVEPATHAICAKCEKS